LSLVWNPITLPAFASSAVTFVLAWIVYSAAPRLTANRFLALALACEGLALALNYGFLYSLTDPDDALAAQVAGFVAFALSLVFYFLFIGTLKTPLTRALRTSAGRLLVALLGAALVVSQMFPKGWAFVGVDRVTYATWEAVPGPGYYAIGAAAWLFALLGLAAAISTLRRSRGATSRAKARAYVVAFSIHDVTLFLNWASWAAFAVFLVPGSPTAELVVRLLIIGYPILQIVFVGALAYGILKTQLYDIDLKLKWTISRGTVSAVFLAVFFVTAQVVQNFTSTTLGWLGGAVVAGLLLFFLRPVERAANRLADAAMPKVQDTEEYAAFRKMEVYKAAVEELVTGGITPKERRALDALRAKLGVAAGAASAMERDVIAMRGVA
jgi:hypothetical protein